MENKIVLVTGAAGFIGYHLCNKLINQGYSVIGVDNLNEYYEVKLKYSRLEQLGINRDEIDNSDKRITSKTFFQHFIFIKTALEDQLALTRIFEDFRIDIIVNLAAQAGVRYSIENPNAYISSNVVGYANLIELAKAHKIKHFIYASSSSVYGENEKVPFHVNDYVDRPISLYAATKKSNELIAYTYSHLFELPVTGLRFFTVYGPWGRPDMAMYIFTKAIKNGEPIKVFNKGNQERDFTYIDDIINGLFKIIEKGPISKYNLYNLGNGSPVKLFSFIKQIEKELGISAKIDLQPKQPGDVTKTWADCDTLIRDYNYNPMTPLEYGVKRFVDWFEDYYK